MNQVVVWAGLALVSTSMPVAGAAGDPSKGARAFQQCTRCHSVQPGRHLTGPSLAHVYGRKAGSAEGYDRYSAALQRSGIVWNASSLDRWLADPLTFRATRWPLPASGMPARGTTWSIVSR